MPGEDRLADGHGCCYCLVRFLIVCGFAALFLWLSLRTNNPTCSIEQFHVFALNGTSNSRNASATASNRTIFFDLKLKNRNKDKGVFYDVLNLTFSYGNRSSDVAAAAFPAFYQGHDHSAQRPLAVDAEGVDWRLPAQKAVEEDGLAVFRVELATAVRYKIVFWKTKRRRLELGADLPVDGEGNLIRGRKGVKLTSGAGKGQRCYRVLGVAVVSGLLHWWFNGGPFVMGF